MKLYNCIQYAFMISAFVLVSELIESLALIFFI